VSDPSVDCQLLPVPDTNLGAGCIQTGIGFDSRFTRTVYPGSLRHDSIPRPMYMPAKQRQG
jgi:hypothetical protein